MIKATEFILILYVALLTSSWWALSLWPKYFCDATNYAYFLLPLFLTLGAFVFIIYRIIKEWDGE